MRRAADDAARDRGRQLAQQAAGLKATAAELEGGNGAVSHALGLQRHDEAIGQAAGALQGSLQKMHEALVGEGSGGGGGTDGDESPTAAEPLSPLSATSATSSSLSSITSTQQQQQQSQSRSVAGRLAADNGEAAAVAGLRGLRSALAGSRDATARALSAQQERLSAAALRLDGTRSDDERSLGATLGEIDALVKKGCGATKESLDKHDRDLDAHATSLQRALDEQKRAQEQMKRDVMAGVTALLTTGFDGLTARLSATVGELSAQNERLKIENRTLHGEVSF